MLRLIRLVPKTLSRPCSEGRILVSWVFHDEAPTFFSHAQLFEKSSQLSTLV